MKKLICFLILLAGVGISFAQEIKVKTGDSITVFRFPDIQKEVQLKFKSITWNEAVVEVVK